MTLEKRGVAHEPIREQISDVAADPEELVWGIVGRALGVTVHDHGFLWRYPGLMTWLAPRPLTIFTAGYRPKIGHVPFTPSALVEAFRGVLLINQVAQPN